MDTGCGQGHAPWTQGQVDSAGTVAEASDGYCANSATRSARACITIGAAWTLQLLTSPY